jgi:hypothetical protein
MTTYSVTRVSSNVKTGPILTTITSRDSCPDNCSLKGSGCYAETGHVRMHWNNASKPFKQGRNGFTGGTLGDLCASVKSLPKGALWRHNVSGDLPHLSQCINNTALSEIVKANHNKRGFTYTHHKVIGLDTIASENRDSIARANKAGFTINLSADTLDQADQLKALNIGPVVCIVPEDHPQHSTTPAGNPIVICPAVTRDDVTCASCGLCAVSTRRSIVGFPVHGAGKKKADNVFKGISIQTIKG